MWLRTTPVLMMLWRLTYKILHRRPIRLLTPTMQLRRTMMMPARRCFLSSFSRHRFRHSIRFALIQCLLIRYRIQQLLQLLLVASRLLLLQHLRLCSIALLLTRCRMRLFVVVFDRARSLRASPPARCSNLRLVASRWRLLALLSPTSRWLSTSCFLS
jgi:hypothetical protein